MAASSRRNSNNPPGGGPLIVAPRLWSPGGNPGYPLSDEERALLALIATVVRFKKGEMIYEQGDDAVAIFNIITGVVKSFRPLPNQKQHIIGFLFANDVIGLAQDGQYVNSAEAVTATSLYKISTRALESRLRQYPNLDFQVIAKLSSDLREAQRHAYLLSKRRALTKIALFIQMLETHQTATESNSSEVYLPMSRLDIGAYVGISAEAVSRSFRDLVRRGAITFRDHRHLKIADRAQLEAVISETERPNSP
jgi:CRP/FNR family transcriptional regulator, anaerobic regulatory protein